MVFRILILLCLVFNGLTCALSVKAQETWHGITPLVTTRQEVEKKIGRPGPTGFYELEEGRVFITYVNTPCEKILRCDCLAPIGVVQQIAVTLYTDLFVKNLNLLSRGFKKIHDRHFPEVITYSNRLTGVRYDTQHGRVTKVRYYESQKTCNSIERGH